MHATDNGETVICCQPLFVDPPEGAVLHDRSGRKNGHGLEIPVLVSVGSMPVDTVWADGIRLDRSGGMFSGWIGIEDGRNEIVARADAPDGPILCATRVLYDSGSFPRYRFAIDDNIYFLESLARERPRSIFDCFYLNGLRDLHRRYGTRFVLNLFFQTPDGSFRLDEFPDDYRGEFTDHADWLSLAFHGRSEFPDRPYESCDPEILAADYDLVANEILRFAGEAAYSPTTITHWAATRADAGPVFRRRNSRVLSGLFTPVTGTQYTGDGQHLPTGGVSGAYECNYGVDDSRSAILSTRDLLVDFSSGILFSKVDLICNNVPAAEVERALGPLAASAPTSEIMDLITHEQYFWPHYSAHRPDHFERCEAAIRFCAERGYRPVFLHRGLAGSETGGDQW